MVVAQLGKGRIDLTPAMYKKLYQMRHQIMTEIVKREGHELPPLPQPQVDKKTGAPLAVDKEKEAKQKMGIQAVVSAALLGMLEERCKNLYKSGDLAKEIKEGIKTVNNGEIFTRIYTHYSSSIRQHNPNYQQLCTMIQSLHTVTGTKKVVQLAKQRLLDMPDLAGTTTPTVKRGRKRGNQKQSPSNDGSSVDFTKICYKLSVQPYTINGFLVPKLIKMLTPADSQQQQDFSDDFNLDSSGDNDSGDEGAGPSTTAKKRKLTRRRSVTGPPPMIDMEASDDDDLNLDDDEEDDEPGLGRTRSKTARL